MCETITNADLRFGEKLGEKGQTGLESEQTVSWWLDGGLQVKKGRKVNGKM